MSSDSLTPLPSSIPPGSIVDTYLRDSGGEGQDRSVGRQLESIKAYCARHNLKLRHVYVDEAKSGKSTASRDQFDRMIADTREAANRPVAILIWNYARFARDLDDSTYYKTLLRKKRGVVVHSLTDPIPEGPYARMVEFLIDVANEEKSRQTAIDTKDGIRSIVMQGAVPGVPPRGIKREPIVTINPRTGQERKNHRWVPDPKFRSRIQKAFQMRAARKSLNEIQKAAKLFTSVNSYATFWKNPIYYGALEYGGMTFPNYCEPIVSKELWDKVQLVQQEFAQGKHIKTGDKNHPRRAASDFLLSGLARCARCGSPLFGRTSHQKTGYKYQSYLCTLAYRKRGECSKGRIPRPAFEAAVINALADFILLEENVRQLYRLAGQRDAGFFAEHDQQRKEIGARIASAKKQIDNVTNAIAETGVSAALSARLKKLELEQTELEQSLLDLAPVPQLPDFEKTKAHLPGLARILKNGEPDQVKTILRSLISHIDVERDGDQLKGTIYYYLPDDDDIMPPTDGEDYPPPPDANSPPKRDDVPKSHSPSGPPIRRHIIQHHFIASTKRPR